MTNAQRDVFRKKRVLEHAERIGKLVHSCRIDEQLNYSCNLTTRPKVARRAGLPAPGASN